MNAQKYIHQPYALSHFGIDRLSAALVSAADVALRQRFIPMNVLNARPNEFAAWAEKKL